MIGIYSITNTINNKKYIGQSIKVEHRIADHKWALKHNRHGNNHLQNSFNKYGEESFTFDIICECKEDELDDLERYYIYTYNCTNSKYGYNAETGGCTNKHASEELKAKMRKNRGGEKSAMWGKKHSEETKKIMREKALGRKLSEETKKKLSISHKGKNCKYFYCVETDTTFCGAQAASEFAGLKSPSSIFECVAGRKKSAGRHPETDEPLHWIKLEDKIS